MGVDGDQADRAGLRRVAQSLRHAGLRQTQPGGGQQVGQHQFPRLGVVAVAWKHQQLGLVALVRGDDAPAVRRGIVNAENAPHRAVETADGARLVQPVVDAAELRQHPVARSQRGVALPFRHQEDARRVALAGPGDRAGRDLAVRIGAGHFQNGDLRQRLRRGDALVASAFHGAVGLQLFQKLFQLLAVGAAGQLEGACDLALADRSRAVADEGEDRVLVGKATGKAAGAAGHVGQGKPCRGRWIA